MTLPTVLAFGEYELHTDSGELFRAGERVPLQHQPAQLLEVLARRAGDLISREEIRREIWGTETYVDSEQGINYCISQVRQALDDDAAAPRFIETVPRRGYRFVAPVEAREIERGEGRSERAGPVPRGWRIAAVALAVVVVVLLLAAVVRLRSGAEPPFQPPSAPAPLVVPEDAHARMLEARYLVERAPEGDTVPDSTRAIELLQAVIEEVPEYAEAHSALADAWLLRLDLPRSEAMERAEEAARRALELDPTLVEARTVLAAALFFHRLDWEGAWQNVAQALESDPDYADAVVVKGLYLSAVGRHDEAIAAFRRASQLEPGQLPGISIAWIYFFARRYDRAVEEAERILVLQPEDEPSHRVLLFAHLARGDEAAAGRELDRYFRATLDLPPDEPLDLPPVRELYAIWWENRGSDTSSWMSPTFVATFAAVAGIPDGALGYLRQACVERTASWDLPFLAVDPRWDLLRGDPRFDEVVDCVGIPGVARDRPVLDLSVE